MKRKKIVIAAVVITIFLVAFYFLEIIQKPVISGTLSERTKEFIKKQAENPGSEFRTSGDERYSAKLSGGQRVDVGKCFSFVLPYDSFNERAEFEDRGDECTHYYAFRRPNGHILTFSKDGTHTDFDTVEGVRLRRDRKDEYQESQKEIKGQKWVIFKKRGQGFEVNAMTYYANSYIVFNLTLNGSNNPDKVLEKALGSITLINEN